jgi:hypothetical protein
MKEPLKNTFRMLASLAILAAGVYGSILFLPLADEMQTKARQYSAMDPAVLYYQLIALAVVVLPFGVASLTAMRLCSGRKIEG